MINSQYINVFIELPILGEVEFFAHASEFYLENDGIGAYEYFGHKGYDFGGTYIMLDNIHWDRDKYTIFDNKNIENYIYENDGGENCPYQKLCDKAGYLFENEY